MARHAASPRRYPRAVRVNEVLREVIADALERILDEDDRLRMVTITAVDSEPDLRHAVVLYSTLQDETEVAKALESVRHKLQGAIARQVTFKRTPQLSFRPDPAILAGRKVEDLLRDHPVRAEEVPVDEDVYKEGDVF